MIMMHYTDMQETPRKTWKRLIPIFFFTKYRFLSSAAPLSPLLHIEVLPSHS